ncbi:MAG: hypothetical protein NVS2B8_03260 [Vulcanimicrobiaceae bacterium]
MICAVIVLTVIASSLAVSYVGVKTAGTLVASKSSDFREFYCAGEAVVRRADPYRVEPLRSCTRRVEPRTDPAWLVTPAPLPGYTLALFALLATLPFDLARLVWEGACTASVLLAALALARLTRRSWILMLVVLLPTDGFLNFNYGEIPPLVIAALAVGALALERQKVALPAICAGIAMLEPHVGLPALIALFIARPRARVWAIGVAIALALTSVVAIGLPSNVEYFRFILPLQAAAEVMSNDQYSFTHVAATLGVAPPAAIALGSLWYLAMVILGVRLAVVLGRRRRLAYVLLIPPAAAVFGGSFVHDIEIAAALPLALLIFVDAPALRMWVLGAVICLLLPATSHRLTFFPLPALSALLATIVLTRIAAQDRSPEQRGVLFASIALVAGAVVVWLSFGTPAPHAHGGARVVAIAAHPVSESAYAPVVWAAFIRSNVESSASSPRYLVEKIPAWLALTGLLGCSIRLALVTRGGVVTSRRETGGAISAIAPAVSSRPVA